MPTSDFKTYTPVLQITPEQIALLSDDQLNDLMRQLFLAQAYRCKADTSKICVNTEIKASDDGCDGWTPKPERNDSWFGDADTCWQFKSGKNGEPSKLAGEVIKSKPKETLTRGGRFVVIANASTSGVKGEEARHKILVDEALAEGIPTDKIIVMGSEKLTTWCNDHPAIAARFSGQPDGLWLFSDWAQKQEHAYAWQTTPENDKELSDYRDKIDFNKGPLLHLHIEGRPGVGKSRFALELCRGAEWKNEVIYFRQESDFRLSQLIDIVSSDHGKRLVIVADEVQSDKLSGLRDSIERANGRIRLITIGHEETTDPVNIPAKKISPLSNELLTKIINGWFSAMPREHVEFVVRTSDGYVRLARLVSESIMKNPNLKVAELFNEKHIRRFLDTMLGADDKRSLHVVAVLTSVGWTGEKEEEGKIIAEHFHLNWSQVRSDVEKYHNLYGIAPRSGRYRYISPTPLGNYLALDAWECYPTEMKSLPAKLPTLGSKNAYYDRMKNIVSSPQTKQFAKEELNFFLKIDDYFDEEKTRYWSVLSSADPGLASKNIFMALKPTTIEQRLQIQNRPRRELINALVSLSWNSISFKNSVLSLALLAEAENETWANNSSHEFIHKFQISLGGTSVPYVSRLEVLDELLLWNRNALTVLVIKALSMIGKDFQMRSNSAPFEMGAPEIEWFPHTTEEYCECIFQATQRLIKISNMKLEAFEAALIRAASDLSVFFKDDKSKKYVRDLFTSIAESSTASKLAINDILENLISDDVKYRKELNPDGVKELDSFRKQFEDLSLTVRMHKIISKPGFHSVDKKDFIPIAKELLSQREILLNEWKWLTSGQASLGWFLGEAMESVSDQENYELTLLEMPNRGSDLRLICGFMHGRVKRHGVQWLDSWLTDYKAKNPKEINFIFEVSWRCDVSVAASKMIIDILNTSKVEKNIVAQLSFGLWADNLPFENLKDFINVLIDKEHIYPAVNIFQHRLTKKPAELNDWEPIVIKLLTNSELIRDRQMGSYHWREIALKYYKKYPKLIVKSIFQEHDDRKKDIWFIEHSDAEVILRDCAELDSDGVWKELKPFISNKKTAYSFAVGFPSGVIEYLPRKEILDWIEESYEDRASLIIEMTGINLSSDETISAEIIGKYSNDERLSYRFFSTFVSGSWVGEASEHWFGHAKILDQVAQSTMNPNIKAWAERSAIDVRAMGDKDRLREEEEKIRDRY